MRARLAPGLLDIYKACVRFLAHFGSICCLCVRCVFLFPSPSPAPLAPSPCPSSSPLPPPALARRKILLCVCFSCTKRALLFMSFCHFVCGGAVGCMTFGRVFVPGVGLNIQIYIKGRGLFPETVYNGFTGIIFGGYFLSKGIAGNLRSCVIRTYSGERFSIFVHRFSMCCACRLFRLSIVGIGCPLSGTWYQFSEY